MEEPVDELALLQVSYASALAAKAKALREALAKAREHGGPALTTATSLAHRIRGTAGSYDFLEVGASAGAIEDALREPVGDRSQNDRWRLNERAMAELAVFADRAASEAAPLSVLAGADPTRRPST